MSFALIIHFLNIGPSPMQGNEGDTVFLTGPKAPFIMEKLCELLIFSLCENFIHLKFNIENLKFLI